MYSGFVKTCFSFLTDQITSAIGNIGKWQWMIILPLAIREIFSSWQMLSPPFLAMAPNYFCNESGHENFQNLQDWQDFANVIDTGKSLSEALIYASTNPQYDDRLFIQLHVQYMKIPSSNPGRTCCVQKSFLTFRTIFVHNIFSPCSSKRRASDKDLPEN